MRYRRTYRPPDLDRDVQHARLRMALEARRGRPLEPGEKLPGCGCSRCTSDDDEPPPLDAA